MKKKREWILPRGKIEKLNLSFKKMKLTVIFTMLVFATFGNVFSQVRVTLKFDKATIQQVFETLEDQTDFIFLYKDEIFDQNKRYSINYKNAPFKEVLESVCEKSGVDYEVRTNGQIILTEKKKQSALEIIIQQRAISGVVTDSQGQALPGVSIVVKGTTTGTVTNSDGEFSLRIPEDAEILQFSFVGMKTQGIPIEGKTTFTVVMEEETIGIEEVVAVGYGVQKKTTLTGSVASVDAEYIENRPLTNASQALQGVNGLYVNQAGGQPGADNATIRIRGVGTLNNNNPLVLVDGIEFNLKDINPNDIENISVLKDAASASIYGNRAANGVILITTKEGKRGKLKVELNSYYGLQQATYLPDVVSNSVDYMNALNQAYINEGQNPYYTEEQIEEYRQGSIIEPELYPNNDWYDIMYSVAPIHDHQLRLSGGDELVTYSMSLGYMDQEGILMGTDANKYSLSTNIIFNPTKRLKLGANVIGSYWIRNDHPCDRDIHGQTIQMIAKAVPMNPTYLPDGRYGDTWLRPPGQGLHQHPIVTATEGINNTKTQRAMIKLSGEYILPWDIKYTANVGINKYEANNHLFVPKIWCYTWKAPDVPEPINKDPRHATRENSSDLNITFYQTLNWSKNIERHNVSLLLGHSTESFNNSDFYAYIEGFLDNDLTEIDAGTINKDVGGTSNESRLMSYFGRANYNYSEKYLLEVNFRYDGSSRFAKGNRWGLFPSLSAAWRINEEPFMSNIGGLSNLKLRFSWGQLGNQSIGLYQFANRININQGTTFNNAILAGSAVTALSDPDISWETTTITNVGLDIGLWNNLELIVDIFEKYTSDILDRINIPAQVGNLSGPITNLYEMSNKGVEASASYINSFGDLRYRIGGNIAFVKNNVEFLDGDVQYNGARIIKEGYPVNSWYMYEALGIFQSPEEIENHAFQHSKTAPGDIKYRDVNNDGMIDINDKRVMGRSIPKYTYGFNMNFNYKGFDLSALFQGVQDIDIYPTGHVSWPLYNGGGAAKEHIENAWTPENTDAKYPRLVLYKRGFKGNSLNSTFWLQDASYLRLKNLQLGYTIPSEMTGRININKVRVYLNAQNLLTLSKYKLSDPEKEITRENMFDYPTTKIFSIGCNITL